MMVGEPIVAVVVGFLVHDEQLAAHGIAAPILAAMVGATTTATVALGRGSGAHHDRLSLAGSGDRRQVGPRGFEPATT